MYGMGGMAKNTLKNVFTSKIKSKQSQSKTHNTNKINDNIPMGHIEKRAASRSLIRLPDGPTSYIPPRIKKSQNIQKGLNGSELIDCTILNGTIINTTLEQCKIDGRKNKLSNLNVNQISISGVGRVNKLYVSRVISDLIPAVTKTYNIGSHLLQWNDIYGKRIDASYGFYLGESTNPFSIVRQSESGNTEITNTTGNLIIENTNTTGIINNKLGSTDNNTSFQINNSNNETKLTVYGDGQVNIQNNLDVGGGIDITADNQSLTFGEGGDLSIIHDGTNSKITSTTGNFEIANTNATGDTVVKLGTDDSDTSFIVHNTSGQNLMRVDGDGRSYFTGKLNVNDTTDATNVSNGALQTDGGLSVVKSVYIGQNLTINGSLNTGCLYSNGGVANGNYYFDGDIYVTGQVITTNTLVKETVTIPRNLDDCAASEMNMGGGDSGPWTSDTDNIYQIEDTKTVLIGSQELIDNGDTTNKLEITGNMRIDGRILCNNDTNATNTTDGSIYTAGGLSVSKSGYFGEYVTANQFIMTSDKRLKKQIKELEKEHEENLDDKFERLVPVKYKWRKQVQNNSQSYEIKKDKYNYGLIAQNVLAEFPECAYEKPDGYLGIDYMGLTSVMILKIQKQNKLIKKNNEEVNELKNVIKKQEIILNNLLERLEQLEDKNTNRKMSSSWDKYENCILNKYKDRDRDNDDDSYHNLIG